MEAYTRKLKPTRSSKRDNAKKKLPSIIQGGFFSENKDPHQIYRSAIKHPSPKKKSTLSYRRTPTSSSREYRTAGKHTRYKEKDSLRFKASKTSRRENQSDSFDRIKREREKYFSSMSRTAGFRSKGIAQNTNNYSSRGVKEKKTNGFLDGIITRGNLFDKIKTS